MLPNYLNIYRQYKYTFAGVRQQLNMQSSYLDLSMSYGSSKEESDKLRGTNADGNILFDPDILVKQRHCKRLIIFACSNYITFIFTKMTRLGRESIFEAISILPKKKKKKQEKKNKSKTITKTTVEATSVTS